MADVTPTPAPAPAVPASTDAPVMPPPQAPDLSALTSPGAQGPTLSQAVSANVAPYVSAEQQAAANIAKASQPTPAAPPPPHAKLLAMVNGLAIGLSAFGTSIATHGQEGGAKEVSQIQAQQQEDKIKAQQAAQAQKDAYIQQQITVMNTNRDMAQNVLFMATLPSNLSEADMKAKEAKIGVLGASQDVMAKALQDLIQTGDYATYQSVTSQLRQIAGEAAPGAAPGAGAPAGANGPAAGVPPAALAQWKNSTDEASQAYPGDPQIQQYNVIANDPQSTPFQLAAAANGAKARMSALDAAVASKTKQNTEEADSLYGKLSQPSELASPGAQAAINAAINDPKTSPTDIPRFRALLPQAVAAQANAVFQKGLQDAAQVAAQSGDPNEAGKALAARQTTISEMKSRGMNPAFITQAIAAAVKIDPSYNAQAEDNFAKVAGSEANAQFFGNVGSLIAKGGTLDQLNEAAKQISQSDYKALNDAKNWFDLQTGKAGISAVQAKIVGVADDAAKVMGGAGVGSDKSREMVLHIIDPSLSPEARQAAIDAMKETISSQGTARMGSNPWLKLEYGSLVNPSGVGAVVAPAGSPAAKLHANLTDFVHQYSNSKGTIYSDDGKNWFDSTGNPVKGK